MDFAALGKHTLTFSSSLFDVASDVINSLNFLGYSTEFRSVLGNVTTESENTTLNCNDSIVCNPIFQISLREHDDVHQIWGIIGLALIFLPGIVGGSGFVVATSYKAISGRSCKYFGISLLFLLMSIIFPFAFLIGQMTAMCMVIFRKKN